MKCWRVEITVSLAIACLTFYSGCVRQPEPESKAQNPLVGTWSLVSAKHGGQESNLAEQYTILKHITPTHYMWVWIDPNTQEIVMSSGGTYALTDETYTESPSFGLGRVFRNNRNSTNALTWRVEDNTWYHAGTLANGVPIEEIWQRQEKQTPPPPAP